MQHDFLIKCEDIDCTMENIFDPKIYFFQLAKQVPSVKER